MNVARLIDLAPTKSEIVALTKRTYETLAGQADLSPDNPVINLCLSRYVSDLLAAEQSILEKDEIIFHHELMHIRPDLLRLLARSECEMEAHFAAKFSMIPNFDLKSLDKFWYRDNYAALVAQEIDGLRSLELADKFLSDPRPLIFVGAGPLPLSAIDYHLQTGKHCVCVDNDVNAVAAGRSMIEKLGLSHAISFKFADGADLDYSGYCLVMLAALAQGKEEMLAAIRLTASETIIGIRSADGLMRLLYEQVDVERVCTCGFEYRGRAAATPVTLNSTCFFSLPNRSRQYMCEAHGSGAYV